MGDKHLYDKDGNYVGRISDESPDSDDDSGPPDSACFFAWFGVGFLVAGAFAVFNMGEPAEDWWLAVFFCTWFGGYALCWIPAILSKMRE